MPWLEGVCSLSAPEKLSLFGWVNVIVIKLVGTEAMRGNSIWYIGLVKVSSIGDSDTNIIESHIFVQAHSYSLTMYFGSLPL